MPKHTFQVGDLVRMTPSEWASYAPAAEDEDILEPPVGVITDLYGDDELIIDWDCGWKHYYHHYKGIVRVSPRLFAIQIGGTTSVDEAIELATKVAQLLGQPAKVIHV